MHLFRNNHGTSGDDWRYRTPLPVSIFQHKIYPSHPKLHNFLELRTLAKIGDDALDGAARDGLGLDGLKILVVLPDVGAEGDDVEALLAEPGEDDGGVEAAGVGEDALGLGFRHGWFWVVVMENGGV